MCAQVLSSPDGEGYPVNPYLVAALSGHDAGLSMVRIAEDRTKRPDGPWKRYQRERADRATVAGWYGDGTRTGVGFATGRVSGGVRLFEFDDRGTFDIFLGAADNIGLGALVAHIRAGYEEETPGGGIHWLIRCDVDGTNTKLAQRPKRADEKRHARDHVQVLIETRGEGGFVITAPSDGRVHPSGAAYRLRSGGFATIATITADEWRVLCDLAHSFDQMPVKEYLPPAARGAERAGGRPGDEFAARTDWPAILEPAGWTFAYRRGETAYWWRPGKGRGQGISATTNHAGSGYLYVFTSSTDLDPGRAYGRFSAYALLHHGGDFRAAARHLACQGFGAPRPFAAEEPHDLAPISETGGCTQLAEENGRLRARVVELQAELAALKEALVGAHDYTPAERLAAIAYIEDLDESRRRGRTDAEGYARTATSVVARTVGVKRTNLAKHLAAVEPSGAFTRRKELIRALDPGTGTLKPNTVTDARLNGSKVEALLTFARSRRTEPSNWGGARTVCRDHPGAPIDTAVRPTHRCGICGRPVDPKGAGVSRPASHVTQLGSPSVHTAASPVMETQLGSPARSRPGDPAESWTAARAGTGDPGDATGAATGSLPAPFPARTAGANRVTRVRGVTAPPADARKRRA